MATGLENVRAEIQKMVDDDPSIAAGTNISVMTETKGALFAKKERIVLSGSVRNELEKRRIEEIAHRIAGNREVINNIKITR
jgi:Flp pilus assembly secretin CpaC